MKRLINSVIGIIFVVLMFTLSIIDVNEVEHSIEQNKENILRIVEDLSEAPHSVMNPAEKNRVFDYLENEVKNMGIQEGDSLLSPSYLVQQYDYSTSVVQDDIEEFRHYDLKNLVVVLPGIKDDSKDAIVFMAHYDSVAMGPGASDDLIQVAVMMETIRLYKEKIDNGYTFSNDIAFVFVDAEEIGLYGSEIFMDHFKGFNNLPSRMKLAINLESRGTSGTLIIFETSENNYNTIELFAKANTNVFTSSIANMVYASMPNGTDFSNLKPHSQGLNFANLGQGENYHSQNDSFANIQMTYISQSANIVINLLNNAIDDDLSKLDDASSDAIFFTYFNATIFYSNTVCTILAILLILLLVSSVVIKLIKKKFNGTIVLKSLAVTILTLVTTALLTFASYYLYSLFAALFGVIDFSSIGKITYSNIYLVIILLLLSLAFTVVSINIFKKVFKMQKSEIRLVITYLLSVITILLSFVLKEASYLLLLPSFLLLVLDICLSFIKKEDFTKIYPIPLIIFGLELPIIIPVLFLAIFALGMTYCFVIGLLFCLLLMMFMEDYAADIKYVSVFSKRKLEKRSPIKGAIYFTSLILFIGIFGVVFKLNLSVNLLGKQSFYLYGYDDALLYVDDNGENYLEVRDLNAYPVLKSELNGFEASYNDSVTYKKDIAYTFTYSKAADITYVGNVLSVQKNDDISYYEVYIENKGINSIIIEYKTESKTIIADESIKTYKFKEIDSFKITIISDSNYIGKINVSEYAINCVELLELEDFKGLKNIENSKYNYQRNLTFN